MPGRPRFGGEQGGVLPPDTSGGAPVYVSVVRQAFSRFGRVELLGSRPPSMLPRTECRPTDRHLTDQAGDTRRSHSVNRRRGKLHRYPPIGQ